MKKFNYLVWIFLLISINSIFADNGGRATRTSTLSNGCGSCHGSQPNVNTSVSFISGSTTVEPGSTNNYSIRVYSSNNINSGINIGVKTSITGEDNAGVLSPGTGMKYLLSELVHSTPKFAQNNNADFEFSWKAPTNPGKYYMRAVGAACNDNGSGSGDTWNWMPVKEIIVRGVELIAPVGGENFCVGATMTIKWNAAAVDNINIDLSFDGGISFPYRIASNLTILGGSYLWNIPTELTQGSNCKIKISDATDANKSSVSKNSFGIYGLFSITKHPISKEMCEGQTYRMSINTIGTGLKYQWRKNGSVILNANDTVYTITNAQPGDEGFYGCVVSSPCQGNVSSTEADIRVRELVRIKQQPTSAITCAGGTVSFSTDADGQDVKYQWFKDNAEVLGATLYRLEVKDITDKEAGRYWCKVSGFCPPTKTTDTVILTVNKPVAITKQPISVELCEKNKAEFSVTVTGEQINYQWFFNDKQLSVPNEPKLTINNVNQANIGKYYCIAGNPCGPNVKSEEVELKVNLLPKIKSQTQNQTKLIGENIEFKINAEGIINSIQWYYNGKAIDDADSLVYQINNLQTTNSGNYYCILTNDCGDVKSVDIKLTVVNSLPGPRLTFANSEINFGMLFTNKMIDSTFTKVIKNSGDAKLVINDITLTNNQSKEFVLLTAVPLTIEPNQEEDLRIIFNPNTPGLKETPIEFNSNSITTDNLTLKGMSCEFIVDNEQVINFGQGNIEGEPLIHKSKLYNFGNCPTIINEIKFTCPIDNPFSLKNPLPLEIKGLDSIELEFEFSPKSTESFLCVADLIFVPDTSSSLSLVGQGITSIEDEQIGLKIYPNPTSSKIMIQNMSEGLKEIIIYNQLGIEIYNSIINANTLTIDLNKYNAESGVYFVKIRDNFNSKIFKIIKIQ